MGIKQRRKLREELRKYFGDNCFWCGRAMIFPRYGHAMPKLFRGDMATIEHHVAKEKGTPDLLIRMRLAHARCNR